MPGLNGDKSVDGSFKKAQAEYDAAKAAWEPQNAKVEKLQSKCTTTPSDPECANLDKERATLKPLKDELDKKKTTMDQRSKELEEAKEALSQAKKQYEDAVETRKIIE